MPMSLNLNGYGIYRNRLLHTHNRPLSFTSANISSFELTAKLFSVKCTHLALFLRIINKMEDIIERIKLLSEVKAKSIREFAGIICVPQTTLNNQLIGKRGLSLEIVLAIVNSFDDISIDWLLRGKGEMIQKESISLIDELKAEVNQLKGENRILREMLNLKKSENSERSKTA